MRFPEFLPEGGRIGLIAPSFGCTTEPYRSCFIRAQENFAKKGYRIVQGPNCDKELGVGKSNTPEACGAEINDFFLHDRADILISCGGGETMCEDLPYVDFAAISRAKPRWFMGYSDNTNLCFTLPTLCDTAAVYGPCVSDFSMEPWHPALEDAFALLTGKCLSLRNYPAWEKECVKDETDPFAPYHVTEPFAPTLAGAEAPVSFSGRLLGGCLDCLLSLCGTPFDRVKEFARKYRRDGILWFLESCDLNPLAIRRGLWQLRQAGWFEGASGFLIGRALHYDEEIMGVDRLNAVTESLGSLGLPLVMDVDLGHLPPMMPLIEGALAEVRADRQTLQLQMFLDK